MLPGGGTAEFVDCPKPPKRGLDAGVVEPVAPAVVPPKLNGCAGAVEAEGVLD